MISSCKSLQNSRISARYDRMNGLYKANSRTREKASQMTTKQLLSNTLAVHNSQSGIPRKKRHARIEIKTPDGQKTVQDEATTHTTIETPDASGKWRSTPQVASLCPFWAITRLFSFESCIRLIYKPSSCVPPFVYDALPKACHLSCHALQLFPALTLFSRHSFPFPILHFRPNATKPRVSFESRGLL